MEEKRKVCGGIIICKLKNRYKILSVYQREHKKWGPPKGGIEFQETEIECAKREIREETGFDIDIKNIKNKTITIMDDTYYILPIHNLLELYENKKNSIDTNEIIDVRWLNIENLKLYITNRHMKEIYKKRTEIINFFEYN